MNPYQKMLKLYNNGFRQTTPATCGPASVILVAQGLGLEATPESLWHDHRFAKWLPVDKFPERGIALHELCFLSEIIYCNKLEITLKRAYPENFHAFKQDLILAAGDKRTVIIVNYLQDNFIKTTTCWENNPHYSPVIALNEQGEVLIADIDAQVKEPYWVPIEQMCQSMNQINSEFGIPRGYLILKKIFH